MFDDRAIHFEPAPEELTSPSIQVKDLELSYNNGLNSERVLGPLSFSVPPGNCVSLVGPSGCGKSSFLKSVLGEIEKTNGSLEVKYAGEMNSRTSVVFQENTVFPWLTALDNVAYPLRRAGQGKKLSRTKAFDWLTRVGLEKSIGKFPSELSGGMLQRVALARALAYQPNLLILDEPFGQLDELTRLDLGLLLAGFLQELQITTVLVTHSIDEALLLSDQILVLSQSPGTVVEKFEIFLQKPKSKETLFEPSFSRLRNEVLMALNLNRFELS